MSFILLLLLLFSRQVMSDSSQPHGLQRQYPLSFTIHYDSTKAPKTWTIIQQSMQMASVLRIDWIQGEMGHVYGSQDQTLLRC